MASKFAASGGIDRAEAQALYRGAFPRGPSEGLPSSDAVRAIEAQFASSFTDEGRHEWDLALGSARRALDLGDSPVLAGGAARTETSNALASVDVRAIPPADWSVFVHLNADNNLETWGYDDLKEMEKVGSVPGKLNVFALVDGGNSSFAAGTPAGWTSKTQLLWVQKDPNNAAGLVSKRIDIDPASKLGQLLGPSSEANMGDPEVLRAALDYVHQVPANHLGVVLWDHGGAWDGMSVDETDKDQLSISNGEVSRALNGESIDFLGADMCLMATEEFARLAADAGVSVFAGSQEVEPAEGWAYTDFLQRAAETLGQQGDLSPLDLGFHAVDSYATGGAENLTLSAIDLTRFGAVQRALDTLALKLVEAGGLNDNYAVAQCYGDALRSTSHPEQMDLGSFAAQLSRRFHDGPLHDAAVAVNAALEATVRTASLTRSRWGDPASGLSIYAPLDAVKDDYRAGAGASNGVSAAWEKFVRTLRAPPTAGFQTPDWAAAAPPSFVAVVPHIPPHLAVTASEETPFSSEPVVNGSEWSRNILPSNIRDVRLEEDGGTWFVRVEGELGLDAHVFHAWFERGGPNELFLRLRATQNSEEPPDTYQGRDTPFSLKIPLPTTDAGAGTQLVMVTGLAGFDEQVLANVPWNPSGPNSTHSVELDPM